MEFTYDTVNSVLYNHGLYNWFSLGWDSKIVTAQFTLPDGSIEDVTIDRSGSVTISVKLINHIKSIG